MENLKGVSNSTIENFLKQSMYRLLRLATSARHKRINMNLRISKAKSEGASELDIQRMETVVALYDKHFTTFNDQYLLAKDAYEAHINKLSYKAQKKMIRTMAAIKAVPGNIKFRFNVWMTPSEDIRGQPLNQDARELFARNRVVKA